MNAPYHVTFNVRQEGNPFWAPITTTIEATGPVVAEHKALRLLKLRGFTVGAKAVSVKKAQVQEPDGR